MVIEKKGLSAVVSTIILIALSLAVVVIVWTVINNLIERETEGSSSCFGINEKVGFDGRYSCYNELTKELRFMVQIGDIDLDKVKIKISGADGGKTFEIGKIDSRTSFLYNYNNDNGYEVILPEKDGAMTYVFNSSNVGTGKPDSIEIIPVVNGNTCEVADSMTNLGSCMNLVD